MHQGWLPREGFNSDALIRLIGKTALNPLMVLPLILAAKYTKQGEDLAILHPTAFSRVKVLLYLGIARYVNRWLNNRALNNGVSDKYDWKKEIVLITGGAGGIGSHAVQMFAEKGITVVVLDIMPLTFPAGPNVHFYKCDITSTAAVAAVARDIRAQVGHPTVLINNAGVARGKTLLGATEKDIRFTFDVNALAHYWTVKEFLPHMVENNHGMVVTVASWASWITAPSMVDYAASKAASQALHEGLTAELVTKYKAPRVRTVLVNQGYTKTALFQGYASDAAFVLPALEPETVAQAIVEQVLSGKSGHVIRPLIGHSIPGLPAYPHWWQIALRQRCERLMTNWSGRQVVKDLDTFYKGRDEKKDEGAAPGPEGSAVLVPKAA